MNETPDRAGSERAEIQALRGDVEALTGEAVGLKDTILLLRADLRAAEEHAAAELLEAEKRSTEKLKAENAARKRNQKRTWVTIVLDISLSVAGLWLYHSVADTQRQQSQTRTEVLCPLYSFPLASVDPARRAALPAAEQKIYDAEVRVIRDGYAVLGCQPVLPGGSASAG